jgi:hypothetical protein
MCIDSAVRAVIDRAYSTRLFVAALCEHEHGKCATLVSGCQSECGQGSSFSKVLLQGLLQSKNIQFRLGNLFFDLN